MRITRRSVVSSVLLLAAICLAPVPISAANAGSVDSAGGVDSTGGIDSAGTIADSEAVTVDKRYPAPTTGTDATDAAVAVGLALAVGGLTVFTARSIRQRPRRSSSRAR